MEEVIAECPYPRFAKKWGNVLWMYFWLWAAAFVVVPDYMGSWAHYLRSVGIPCFFIGFYGPGFLWAWLGAREKTKI